MNKHPFTVLQELQAEVLLAKDPIIKKLPANYVQAVNIKINKKIYFVLIEEINQIIARPKITKVPGVVTWFKGLANIKGELVTINSLSEYLQGQTDCQSSKLISKVIIVKLDKKLYGFLVDNISGIENIKSTTFDTNNKILLSLTKIIKRQKFDQIRELVND